MMRTPSQTVGPYYLICLCREGDDILVDDGIELTGQLLDGQEEPIWDGMIELWDGTHWGRSRTDTNGFYSFTIPPDADHFETFVFARGLLRHQLTRIYVNGEPPDPSMLAVPEDGRLRFDIRMQGDRATVFYEH